MCGCVRVPPWSGLVPPVSSRCVVAVGYQLVVSQVNLALCALLVDAIDVVVTDVFSMPKLHCSSWLLYGPLCHCELLACVTWLVALWIAVPLLTVDLEHFQAVRTIVH